MQAELTVIKIYSQLASGAITLRSAQTAEIQAMLDLFDEEVRAGRMLPRNPNEVRAHIDDWIVSVEGDQVVGCVSLVFYNGDLCEIRSLAVDPEKRGLGIGVALVEASLELARERRMSRVLTLTRAARLFEKLGFQEKSIEEFPLKVRRDCRPCPFRHCCDEVALLYLIDEEGAR
ncbi:MAG: GNAT family N-acetyltransferase [Anaerolineae bacterium]|nr:GNAT family N-acetyltransferase [Anaerolineae bacterium]